jgi:hypothetical protein
MDGVVPFEKYPVCGYKRSAIAFARNFYWTPSAPSLSIEVMQETIAAGNDFQQKLAEIGTMVVRTLTDIAVSVMFGLTLVALASLADALQLTPTKGATVREILRFANQYTDLPQWWWVGLYALLAGASALFARVYPQPHRLPVEATFSLLSRDDTRTYPTVRAAVSDDHRPTTSRGLLSPSRDSSTTALLMSSA